MDATIRIRPDSSQLVLGERTVPMHTLWLGGIPRGAVLILLDADSTDYDSAEAMNELATHGYESLAAVQPADLDDESRAALVDLLVARLAERGWTGEQIGVIGFGTGGSAALLAAVDATFGGAVSVAPTGLATLLTEPDRLSDVRLRTPWLGLFGSKDASVSGEVLADLRSTLESQTPVYSEVVQYPGVAGGFYRDSHRPLVHAAAFDAWQRIVEWLDAMVVPRPTPLAEVWRLRVAVSAH